MTIIFSFFFFQIDNVNRGVQGINGWGKGDRKRPTSKCASDPERSLLFLNTARHSLSPSFTLK